MKNMYLKFGSKIEKFVPFIVLFVSELQISLRELECIITHIFHKFL
jgi:uncharacterized protein YjaZ